MFTDIPAMDNDNVVKIHRAPWVLPMGGEPLLNGAVAVYAGKIVAVAGFPELRKQYPDGVISDHDGYVIMPALINGHIHLELSHLAHLGKEKESGGFTAWLSKMLVEREALGAVGTLVEEAASKELYRQFRDGVVVLADIGNTGITTKVMGGFPGLVLPFLEYLGLSRSSLKPAAKKLAKKDNSVFCTAHAPYSTHPELIKLLKKRAVALNHIFPIHTAEPIGENAMLSQGRGEIVDFLTKRGFYDCDYLFIRSGIDINGSVDYLHALGVMDMSTLCVHGVHVSEREIDLICRSGAGVCLCPGSNQFLQVGKAPLEKYLAGGILPAIGTDSAASNPELSLWREMKLLLTSHPQVDPLTILKMATIGGARALAVDDIYGSLENGKSAMMLAVPVKSELNNVNELYAAIIDMGSELNPKWIGATWSV
jgi:cytosine/adenosine deaminase-related metal-dependent hydrolase